MQDVDFSMNHEPLLPRNSSHTENEIFKAVKCLVTMFYMNLRRKQKHVHPSRIWNANLKVLSCSYI